MELLRYLKERKKLSINRMINKQIYIQIAGVEELKSIRDDLMKFEIYVGQDIITDKGLIKAYKDYVELYSRRITNMQVDNEGKVILYIYIDNDVIIEGYTKKFWITGNINRYIDKDIDAGVEIYRYTGIELVE